MSSFLKDILRANIEEKIKQIISRIDCDDNENTKKNTTTTSNSNKNNENNLSITKK